MGKAGWTKRVPEKPGSYWRRRLCECGNGWMRPEVVHLEKSKRVAGALSEGNWLGVVVGEDPAAQWITTPATLPSNE